MRIVKKKDSHFLSVENAEHVENYIEETSWKRDLSLLNYTADKNASSNISPLIHTIADSLWVLSIDPKTPAKITMVCSITPLDL